MAERTGSSANWVAIPYPPLARLGFPQHLPPTPKETGGEHVPRRAGAGYWEMWTVLSPHSRCPLNLALSAPGGARALLFITEAAHQSALSERSILSEARPLGLPQRRPPGDAPRCSPAQPINARLVSLRLAAPGPSGVGVRGGEVASGPDGVVAVETFLGPRGACTGGGVAAGRAARLALAVSRRPRLPGSRAPWAP